MKRFFNQTRWLVLTLVLLVFGVALADHTLPEIRNLLGRMDRAMAYLGYIPTQGHILRYLPQGYQLDVPAYFKRGTPYSVGAFCDSDCDDVDLVVFDMYGNQVAADLEPDDTPSVDLTIYRTGWFKVRVVMESCYARNCAIGLGVYGR